MNMVERMARAMVREFECRWEALNGVQQEMARFRARAALKAMREPTEAMKRCGIQAGWSGVIDGSAPLEQDAAAELWGRMIDAALAEDRSPPAA